MTAALEPGLRTRAFVFNTLLHDKAVDDRLRRYPHWLAARNLANEASDESVEALVEAVRGALRAAARWYRLKARLLGLDRLADYDRAAAVGDGRRATSPGPRRRELVLDAYGELLARARRPRASASSTSAGSTRPVAPRQARRRVLRLHASRPCTPT